MGHDLALAQQRRIVKNGVARLVVKAYSVFEPNVEQTSAMAHRFSSGQQRGSTFLEPNCSPVTDVLREFPEGSH